MFCPVSHLQQWKLLLFMYAVSKSLFAIAALDRIHKFSGPAVYNCKDESSSSLALHHYIYCKLSSLTGLALLSSWALSFA